MNTIITSIDTLLSYLKIPDFDNSQDQEVAIRKITQQAIPLEDEYMLLNIFEINYKEISIPQTLYIDSNNVTYKRTYLNEENIFFQPFTYNDNDDIFDSKIFPEPLTEVFIPEEIYNGGYEFYINKENQIVASVKAVTLNNSKNYISFNVSSFSYLKTYPLLKHNYTSVYGVANNETIKITTYTKNGLVHRFPILTKTFDRGYMYRLSFYYEEKNKEVRTTSFLDDAPIALSIYFKNLEAVLDFLNQTIFWYYNDFNDYQSRWRSKFLTELTYNTTRILNSGGNSKKKVAVIYHLPEPMYYAFHSIPSLWNILIKLAEGYVRNSFGINEEDLILKILAIIYHRYTNKKTTTTIDGDKREEEISTDTIKKHDFFIKNLISKKVEGKLLLYKLVKGLDGEEFKKYIHFIWSIWKNSSYAIIDPTLNEKVTITKDSPVLIDYRSDKALGFHFDNAQINWEGSESKITIEVNSITGTKEVPEIINIGDDKPIYIESGETEIIDVFEKQTYNYHPFAPVILNNSDNPKFILKDNDDSNIFLTKLPAFILFANNEAAFWENVITGVEYGVDILTTISGVGNLLKAGRLFRLLKNGRTLLFRTAVATTAIAGVKTAAGIIEVSSGTVNTLFKLTGLNDTELGKTITKYLFYLEMASLTTEVTVLLKGKLTKTAKELVENPKLEKSLDDLVKKGEINEGEKLKLIDDLELSAGLKNTAKLAKRTARTANKGSVHQSFFKNLEVKLRIEETINLISGQTKDYTCVANSLRMVLSDLGKIEFEDTLVKALKTDRNGARIFDIPEALKKLKIDDLQIINRASKLDKNITFETLQKALNNRKAIVGLNSEDLVSHAVVVDKIENGRVFVRDPLPLNQGSYYSVSIENFKEVFNKKFVIIQ